MTTAEFAAQGRDLIARFAQATAAQQRVGELAGQMLAGPISAEQFAEMERLVEQVATHTLGVRAELVAYNQLLRARSSAN